MASTTTITAPPPSSSILLRNGTVLTHNASTDKVTALSNTDVLIVGSTISQIGPAISPPPGHQTKVIDCTDKIVSPGFVDTHHHLWQTQLKGRIADETLLDYFPIANMQSYNYTPQDIFWGQLSGCLEALNCGTTFVLDHMHGAYTAEHANQALAATTASGLRSVYAYAPPIRMARWTDSVVEPEEDLLPEWALSQLESWCHRQTKDSSSSSSLSSGRVQFGLGFDYFFLPRDVVVGLFDRFRAAGAKLITSHISRNAVQGMSSTTRLLKDYGLLQKDILLSHCTGIEDDEKQTLYEAGVYVSSTPESECQMGMGWSLALEPGVHGSLGIDCHTNNSSSILTQGRMALQMARQQTNQPLLAEGDFPRSLRGDTQRVFNLATIDGARAVGMEKEIGSLEGGKKADVLVFDATSPSMLCAAEWDPVVAVVRHSDVGDVECVIVDGVVRKDNGKLVDVEIEEGGGRPVAWKDVVKEVIKSQTEIQKKIEGVSLPKAKELLMKMWYIDGSKFKDVV